MKRTLITTLILLIGLLISTSCTDNRRARNWGGTETIRLREFTNPTEKVINVTWKGDNLWILTQDTVSKTLYFREKSNLGIAEGKVIINP